MRTGTTLLPASSAMLTSRGTCGEALACSDSTTTVIGQAASAARIWSGHGVDPDRLCGAIHAR